MSMLFDRRTALVGAGVLLLPVRGFAQAPAAGFTHGVASGEPSQRSMLFWTRFVNPAGTRAELELEVSTSPRMARPVARVNLVADPADDWCARTVVQGLAPGTTYYYRFAGPGRARSMVGRTKTLPETNAAMFRIGLFSCSNLPFGWFNGYGHAAAADDIDLFVHVGDYIYEYARGTYPAADQVVAGRVLEPAGETIALADYRTRYAAYRADPDLQALHALFPAVTTWDDHEIANDAWVGGAENHDPSKGPWDARLAAARKAYREWMPVSDAAYARYDIGRLASLYRLDTRVEGRDRQLDLMAAVRAGGDIGAALVKFRDEQWMAGNRQLLGAKQEQWLFGQMAESAKAGMRWQVLAQQVIMGTLRTPTDAAKLLPPDADARVKALVEAGAAAARVGLPLNFDAWDGYPAARARLLAAAQKNAVNLIVLAGDSHNAWGFDLANDGRPAGVEFATQSVTSPGFEAYLSSVPPKVLGQAMMDANPGLRWCETSGRGYTHVTLTPAEAVGEWRFTAPVAARAPKLAYQQRARVAAGSNRLRIG